MISKTLRLYDSAMLVFLVCLFIFRNDKSLHLNFKLFVYLGSFIQQHQKYLFGKLKPEILHSFLKRISKYSTVILKSDPT